MSPENYGTRGIPQIESREPLWAYAALASEVEAGHWLPDSETGQRQTIVISPRHARPLLFGLQASRSARSWATPTLIVVDAMIFASLAFAHLHVPMRATVCPPLDAATPADAAA